MSIGMVKHHGIKRGSGGSARMASAYINADIADEKVNIIMRQDTYSTEQLQGFLRDAGMSDLLAERFKFNESLAEMAHILGANFKAGGLRYDYSYKKEVTTTHFFLPDYAPQRLLCSDISSGEELNKVQRQRFWKAVEERETTSNALLANSYIFSLPNEFYQLSDDVQAYYEKEICDRVGHYFADKGYPADLAVHHKDIRSITYIKRVKEYNSYGEPTLTKSGKHKYHLEHPLRYEKTEDGWFDKKDERILSLGEVSRLQNYHLHANVSARAIDPVTHEWSQKAKMINLALDDGVIIPIPKATPDVDKLCRAYEAVFNDKVTVMQSPEDKTKLIFINVDSSVKGKRIPLLDNHTYTQKVRSGNRKEWQRERISIAEEFNVRGSVSIVKEAWNGIINPIIKEINRDYGLNINPIDCRSNKLKHQEELQLHPDIPNLKSHIPLPRLTSSNSETVAYIKEENKLIDDINSDYKKLSDLNDQKRTLFEEITIKIKELLSRFKGQIEKVFIEFLRGDPETSAILDDLHIKESEVIRHARPTGLDQLREQQRTRRNAIRAEFGEPATSRNDSGAAISKANAAEESSSASRADREAKRERHRTQRSKETEERSR